MSYVLRVVHVILYVDDPGLISRMNPPVSNVCVTPSPANLYSKTVTILLLDHPSVMHISCLHTSFVHALIDLRLSPYGWIWRIFSGDNFKQSNIATPTKLGPPSESSPVITTLKHGK